MDHTLFWLAPEQISYEQIRDFVSKGIEETSVLDYKQIKETGKDKAFEEIYETVAAMANTDGGMILVGVSEKDRKPVDIPGVDPGDEDILKNKCIAILQPSFVPEIIPADVPGTGKRVLVIRMHPGRVPRPVVVREKGVFVRPSSRNAHADLHRLQQLFSETQPAPGAIGSPASLDMGTFQRPEEAYELLVRFVLFAATSGVPFLSGPVKRGLQTMLDQIAIKRWMISRIRLPFTYDWSLTQSTSVSATYICKMTWPPVQFGPLWARLYLALPSNQFPFTVLLDVLFNREAVEGVETQRENIQRLLLPLPWNLLYDLFVAGLETITDPTIWKQFPDSFAIWSPRIACRIGPDVKLEKTWLNLEGLTYETPPTLPYWPLFETDFELETLPQTEAVKLIARNWLTRYLLDSGSLDAEEKVRALK